MKLKLFIVLSLLIVSISCSNDDAPKTKPSSNKEHIFKQQKMALDKAKGVEQLLQTGADNRLKSINEQTK